MSLQKFVQAMQISCNLRSRDRDVWLLNEWLTLIKTARAVKMETFHAKTYFIILITMNSKNLQRQDC